MKNIKHEIPRHAMRTYRFGQMRCFLPIARGVIRLYIPMSKSIIMSI